MKAGKAVYQILTLDEDVAALIGDRVFPELAAQDAATPYVTYHVRSVDPEDSKNGTSTLDVVTFEVFCVGPDYGVLMDVAEACRSAIDRQAGNFNSTAIQSARFMDEDCEFDQDTADFISTQTFEVRHQRTGTITDMGNITIEEADGSPSSSVSTLVFPNGSVSITGETGTIDFGRSAFHYARRSVSSLYLLGGEQEQDFNSATPASIKFDTTDTSTTNHPFTFNNFTIQIPNAGFYRVTAKATFEVETNSQSAPAISFIAQSAGLKGTQTAFAPGTMGIVECSAILTGVFQATNSDSVGVHAFDQSSANKDIHLTSATLEIERVA